MITVRTRSGNEIDLDKPDPSKILLGDICWSLAGQNRWNAHGSKEYYVSDHVQFVAHLVKQDPDHTPADVLECLIHDAPEAYESDIPEPVRQYIRKRHYCLDQLSNKLMACVKRSLGISELVENFSKRMINCDLNARQIELCELFMNQKTSLMYFGDRHDQVNRANILHDSIVSAIGDYRIWKLRQENEHGKKPIDEPEAKPRTWDQLLEEAFDIIRKDCPNVVISVQVKPGT
jgi:5'-deoxynucleotidase YfbR-like HD superfamily hydrolase